jgi:DNA-binding response OmpR family regulator
MTSGTKASLLLVEDNEMLREELCHYLTYEGYEVRGVDCGRDMNAALSQGMADVLILDVNLPEEDGLEIARRVKASMPGIGIVMLTARVRSLDRFEGYASGADVFLTKPTRPEELLAVLNNLLARIRPPRSVPGWRLDVAGRQIRSPLDAVLRLTPTEVILLRELAFFGRCVEHGTLIACLGNDNESDAINKARIEVLVSRLRAKLEALPADGFRIKAVRGQGYQLGFPLVLENLPEQRRRGSVVA